MAKNTVLLVHIESQIIKAEEQTSNKREVEQVKEMIQRKYFHLLRGEVQSYEIQVIKGWF